MTCIAVVDDEAPVRTALGRLLRLADYEVLAFASGEAFLESLGQRVPDGVLLDIHMPGLSGLQVQARLRALHPQLPVLFITASDDAEVERSALAVGGHCVLHKPFSGSDLVDAVEAALRAAPRRELDSGGVPN
jgi:FixJ family two-component response regulator